MGKISTFEQLKAKLAEAEAAQKVSADAFRQALGGWHLSADLFGHPPADPFSDEFKAYQLAIYEKLTDKSYQVENEATDFDFEQELKRPYPYGTQSANIVGSHLIGYGWLIEKMGLPAGASILEIGSGYGTLTVHLANMGYAVTCLDISQPLLDFVQARTADFLRPVQTICGDMATVELEGSYDAIIFNAAFHHALDQKKVAERLREVTAPNGMLVFVAEPVLNRFSSALAYPWGIRLDGLSIWSIIKWGWLELGFRTSYFTKMLNHAGWRLTRHDLGLAAGTDVWIGRRAEESQRSFLGNLQTALVGYEFDLETGAIRMVKRVGRGFAMLKNLSS